MESAHGSSAAEHNASPVWILALQRTLAEPRMGWSLFLLAVIEALRHRDRCTLALLLVLSCQVIFWFFFTHLFARFAVAMLMPLVILAGRSVQRAGEAGLVSSKIRQGGSPPNEGPNTSGPTSRTDHPSFITCHPAAQHSALSTQHFQFSIEHLIFAVLGLGIAANLYCLAGLFYDETRPGGQPLEAYGHTNWFVTGEWPGTAHWGAINALPAESRVMLVGEARTYYLRTPVDYAVVFNHHPLAQAVRDDPEPRHLIAWLRRNGNTHLLLDRSEISRLAGTYGFYPELTPELFAQLEQAGLKRVSDFTTGQTPLVYATLYEVPRHD